MAVNKKRQGYWWSRVHFLLRLLGLTGLLVAIVGGALAYLNHVLEFDLLWQALLAQHGPWPQLAAGLLVGGLTAVLVEILAELYVLVFLTAGRRSGSGLSAGLQVALAVAILVGINVYAF